MLPSNATKTAAFTLIELLVVLAILGLLSTLMATSVMNALTQGKVTVSLSNLRQLGTAMIAYSTDHQGNLPPSMSSNNLVRWHGSRNSVSEAFGASGGYLSDYLGKNQRIKQCPLLGSKAIKSGSFELGAGGYGYNGSYLGGGFIEGKHHPVTISSIGNLHQVIAFATTAFANKNGLQEYPFTDPYTAPSGGYALQPSTHFRANGKAIICWADGHVSKEKPNKEDGPNYYGGDNTVHEIGWFGPSTDNGYWNPR